MKYRKPNTLERLMNKTFGFFVGLGLSPSFNYLLEVTGRKSGRTYSHPVNLMELDGKKYLVATRGYAQWVRNVEAGGNKATLSKRSYRQPVLLTPVENELKPRLIKEYLDRYAVAVQRFFPVKAGSPVEAFYPLASQHPVFEVTTLTPEN